MDRVLPVDNSGRERRQPWILHMMTVNTLNFCSFAVCNDEWARPSSVKTTQIEEYVIMYPPILVAVPNTLDSDGVRYI